MLGKSFFKLCLVLSVSFAFVTLFLAALSGIDRSWDSLTYHLPFAARLWGIIPTENFILPPVFESRYYGFPLFVEFLQGGFWKLTGDPAGANLVGFFSIILMVAFLALKLKLSFFIISIYILSLPVVITHNSSAYIDLPSNVFISIALITILDLIINKKTIDLKNFIIVNIFLIFAATSKFQMLPFALTGWALVSFLAFKNKALWKNIRIKIGLILTLLLIMSFPIKNTLQHGNPVYPVAITLFGEVLPGEAENSSVRQKDSLTWEATSKYLKSLTEFDLYTDGRKNKLFSVDQSPGYRSPSFKLGGFFVINLILWFTILFYFFLKRRDYAHSCLVFFIILSFSSIIFMPASYYLRYSIFLAFLLIYAMHTVISKNSENNKDLFNLCNIIQFCLFLVVMRLTSAYYFLERRSVDPNHYKIESQSEKICIPGNRRKLLFYALANPDKKILSVVLVKDCPETHETFLPK